MVFARRCKQQTIPFFTVDGWWELKLRYCNKTVFHNCWKKVVATQIFHVDIFRLLQKIVNTFLYIKRKRVKSWAERYGRRSFVLWHNTKLSLSRFFKQNTWWSLISTHSRTRIKFSSFEASGTCQDHRTTGYSLSGPLITIRIPKNITSFHTLIGSSLSQSFSSTERRTSGAYTLGLLLTSVRY